MKSKRLALLLVFLLLASCTASERHERTIRYVATTGDDANTCTEVSSPCLTVAEAFRRADADDKIVIAAGIYNEIGRHVDTPVFGTLAFDIWVTGAGQAETIIDLGNTYAGFYLVDAAHLRLENLTVQNARGNSPGGCLILQNITRADLENVTLTRCLYAGISNSATSAVNLINVSVTDSIVREPSGAGTGITNSGIMNIQGGEISGNPRLGIFSRGQLEMDGTLIQNNDLEGIVLNGEATLSNLTIQNNAGNLGHLEGMEVGEGALVSLTDSLISANAGYGIQIVADSANLIVQNTTISDHIFSGISIEGGMLTLDHVIVQNNGIEIFAALGVSGGAVEVRNSRITQNHSGGIYNEPEGEISLIQTVIDQNRGDSYGAFFNEGMAHIETSLIANNIGGAAAAIENRGTMTIINSTVSNNQQLGIYASEGDLFLTYVTIAENEHGGVSLTRQTENAVFTNILVAKNLVGDCNITNPDIPDPVLVGVNIATSPGCAFPATFSSGEIHLAELADNAGPTLTHALLTGSPAIDAATSMCPDGDQRLILRPFGAACDVGAYEAGAVTTSLEGMPAQNPDTLIVEDDFPCYTGPGAQYNTLSTLTKGTELQIVGYGFNGGWLVAFHPNLPDRHCWIDEDFVSFDIPVSELRLIAVPHKPTATATPPQEEREPTEVCVTPINQPNFCD